MGSNRLKINSKKSAMGIQTGAVISANVPVGREGRGGGSKAFRGAAFSSRETREQAPHSPVMSPILAVLVEAGVGVRCELRTNETARFVWRALGGCSCELRN